MKNFLLTLTLLISSSSFGQTVEEYNSDKVTFFYSDRYTLTEKRALVKDMDIKLIVKSSENVNSSENVVINTIDSNPNMIKRLKDDSVILNSPMATFEGFSLQRNTIYQKEILLLTFIIQGRHLQQYNFIENEKLCTITLSAPNKQSLNKMIDENRLILKSIKIK